MLARFVARHVATMCVTDVPSRCDTDMCRNSWRFSVVDALSARSAVGLDGHVGAALPPSQQKMPTPVEAEPTDYPPEGVAPRHRGSFVGDTGRPTTLPRGHPALAARAAAATEGGARDDEAGVGRGRRRSTTPSPVPPPPPTRPPPPTQRPPSPTRLIPIDVEPLSSPRRTVSSPRRATSSLPSLSPEREVRRAHSVPHTARHAERPPGPTSRPRGHPGARRLVDTSLVNGASEQRTAQSLDVDCPVCLEAIDAGRRRPILCPGCGNTVCLDCYPRLARCPSCREPLPMRAVPNVALLHVVAALGAATRATISDAVS